MLAFPLLCPLCSSSEIVECLKTQGRTYLSCERCELLFLDPSQRLSPTAERERYELHENSESNEGYVRFLERLITPLAEHLPEGARGVDFGCGPSAILGRLLERRGFHAANFDPFFYPERPKGMGYDFVTAVEVFEHLFTPAEVIPDMLSLLSSGGVLAVMTSKPPPPFDLPQWYYLRDPTHVSFYQDNTMNWIAKKWRLSVVSTTENVWIFRKI
jgi:hypothetical protein